MSHKIIDRVLGVSLKTREGLNLKLGAYKLMNTKKIVKEHAVVYSGKVFNSKDPVLLRINSACFTGDIFHCDRCDCTWQLLESMKMISQQGGLITYHFAHEGRGIGFVSKLKTLAIMDKHKKTTYEAFKEAGYEPDIRDFASSAFILKDFGINSVRLITNNPDKKNFLTNYGIEVVEMISLVNKQKSLREYLFSKKLQFGHAIDDFEYKT